VMMISFVLFFFFPLLVKAGEAPNQGDDIFLPLIINSGSNPSMINIPAGEFQMGCDINHNGGYLCITNQLPLHTVYLNAYYIDKYEVTNDQMAFFLNSRGSNDCDGYECVDLDNYFSRISWNGSQYVVDSGYDNHPAIEVTWYGANTYCTENNKRLPTEAEWEKAARGTTVQAYPWGDSVPTCALANFWDYYGTGDFCVDDTTSVGSYPLGASLYGVLDMAGNVWEWVNDWYSSSYYSDPSAGNNPPGPGTGDYRVSRGGSWGTYPNGLLVAYRGFDSPVNTGSDYGFRCASSP